MTARPTTLVWLTTPDVYQMHSEGMQLRSTTGLRSDGSSGPKALAGIPGLLPDWFAEVESGTGQLSEVMSRAEALTRPGAVLHRAPPRCERADVKHVSRSGRLKDRRCGAFSDLATLTGSSEGLGVDLVPVLRARRAAAANSAQSSSPSQYRWARRYRERAPARDDESASSVAIVVSGPGWLRFSQEAAASVRA